MIRKEYQALAVVCRSMSLCFVYLLCCVDSDGYEFQIVSLHNKEWQFEATTHDVSFKELGNFFTIRGKHP